MWPIVNGEPEYIGATFMYIDSGIDTGEVIHQIRANISEEDTIHDVGNRLIIKMTESYRDVVAAFDMLTPESQIKADGKLYLAREFTADVCKLLYNKVENGVFKNKSYYRSKPYFARASIDGNRLCLGCFRTAEEASEAYQRFCKEHHGEFYNE